MRVELTFAGLRLIADASSEEITRLLTAAVWRRIEDPDPAAPAIRVIEPEGK